TINGQEWPYMNASLDYVQLLGLFPAYDSQLFSREFSGPTSWALHCRSMFKSAILLAQRSGILLENRYLIHYAEVVTNSNDNGLSILDHTCQKVTQMNITGIVGPAYSSEVLFIAPYTSRIGLPLISYSATNPDLSDTSMYPSFYRLAPSNSNLALAIIKLFELYKWHTSIYLFQNDDYGYAGMKLFRELYSMNITLTDIITFDLKKHEFQTNNINTIFKQSKSRIVLVWANENSTKTILKYALEHQLIGRYFTWIVTSKVHLHNLISLSSQPNVVKENLIGLLTIEPTVTDTVSNETLLNLAIDIWKQYDEYTFPGNRYLVSPFALFVFDATWTLILTLQKLCSETPSCISCINKSYCFHANFTQSDLYHRLLRKISFLGVTGRVEFCNQTNDRLNGAYYHLRNVQPQLSSDGKKSLLQLVNVLKWNETIKQWYNDTTTPKPIVWPNRSEHIPSDHPVIKGITIRIAVIESAPFVMSENLTATGDNGNRHDDSILVNNNTILLRGLCIDLINKLHEKMEFNYNVILVDRSTQYNELVFGINEKLYDIIISDVTITTNRLQKVDFSIPIHENSVRVVVRQSQSSYSDLFSYLKPFSLKLWLAILGIVLYSGCLLCYFERTTTTKTLRNQTTTVEPKSVHQTITLSLYYAWSSLVNMGGGGGFVLFSTASRILTIGLSTISLILLATYTANLSSFLTLQRTQPTISGIDDIKNGRVSYNRIGIVVGSASYEYYINNVSKYFYPLKSSNEIYVNLLNENIDAALWDNTSLEYEIRHSYCSKLAVVGLGFAKSSFGIVMEKNWPYKHDLDLNIVSLRESNYFDTIEREWFHYKTPTIIGGSSSNEHCFIHSNDDDNEKLSITIEIMIGLFLTFFLISLLAVIAHLWEQRHNLKELALKLKTQSNCDQSVRCCYRGRSQTK
ncbi:unnamed protein product, partial [Didymodactylos carnosus]